MEKLEMILDKRSHNFEQDEKVKFYEGIQLNHYKTMTFYVEPLDYSEETLLELVAKSLKSKLDCSPVSCGSMISKYGLCLSSPKFINKKKRAEYLKYLALTI